MFSLSARFRRSRTEGVPGSVYYIIRRGGEERNITGSVRGRSEAVMSEAADRIAYDIMTIYCVIEEMTQGGGDVPIDRVRDTASAAIHGQNPYAGRIHGYEGRYPVRDDIARIAKVFSDRFEPRKGPDSQTAPNDISTLRGYLSALILEYASEGKPSAKSLRSTLRSLEGYMDGTEMPLSTLTGEFVSGYGEYLAGRVSPGTASFYLRNLRTAILRAGREGLLSSGFTWPVEMRTNVPRGGEKAMEPCLGLSAIRQLEGLDLSDDASLGLARDMFMFGFYTHGMELTDIATLTRDNLDGNVLTYRRRLRGRERRVTLGAKAMSIVDRYRDVDREYLFPILRRRWTYAYTTARNGLAESLATIGRRLEPPVRLTFSMNIHSWQSLINTANIAEALVS